MNIKNIDFYSFSGTGNTLLVTGAMRDVFAEAGIIVRMFAMEGSKPADIDTENALGLAFPVAAQSTFPFIWRFVERLPRANGTPVFMVDTLAMFSGGIVGPLRRKLAAKGYKPIGAREIRMPSNFLCGSVDEAKNKAAIAAGLQAARKYARDLLDGNAGWGRVPGLSDLMCLLSRSTLMWGLLRRGLKFHTDHSKCTKCGLCARLCPVENIRMKDYPEHAASCEFCMRCFSFCPAQAVYINKQGRYAPYRAVGEMTPARETT